MIAAKFFDLAGGPGAARTLVGNSGGALARIVVATPASASPGPAGAIGPKNWEGCPPDAEPLPGKPTNESKLMAIALPDSKEVCRFPQDGRKGQIETLKSDLRERRTQAKMAASRLIVKQVFALISMFAFLLRSLFPPWFWPKHV